MNMILSLIFLQTKYHRCHILGAILVLYGAMIDLLPVLTGVSNANMPDPKVGWILLYILSMLPSAASNGKWLLQLKNLSL